MSVPPTPGPLPGPPLSPRALHVDLAPCPGGDSLWPEQLVQVTCHGGSALPRYFDVAGEGAVYVGQRLASAGARERDRRVAGGRERG